MFLAVRGALLCACVTIMQYSVLLWEPRLVIVTPHDRACFCSQLLTVMCGLYLRPCTFDHILHRTLQSMQLILMMRQPHSKYCSASIRSYPGITVRFSSPAGNSRLTRLKSWLDGHCPTTTATVSNRFLAAGLPKTVLMWQAVVP